MVITLMSLITPSSEIPIQDLVFNRIKNRGDKLQRVSSQCVSRLCAHFPVTQLSM